jgi:WD40 repeat protein
MRWPKVAAALSLLLTWLAPCLAAGVPRALAFSPDNRTLAVGAADGAAGELTLWDVRTRKPRWTAPRAHPVRALAWTPDGKTLLVAEGPAVVLFAAATGRPRAVLAPHGRGISCLALTADGRTLATGGADGTIKLWDLAARKERRTIPGHRGAVGSLCFAPKGSLLVSTGDKEARLWDPATGKRVRQWQHDGFFVSSAAFTGDGKVVVTAGYEGSARLWEVETGTLRARFSGQGGLDGVCIEPTTHTMALWGYGRTIALFDLDRRPPDPARSRRIAALLGQLNEDSYATRERATRELKALGWIAEPALRQAARESAAAEVRIRARAVLKALQTEPRRLLRGHTGRLWDVCFARDGKLLASASADGTVHLWDLAGREAVILGR